MNAYWKYNLKYAKNLHFPRIKNPVNDISELTSGLIENESPIGRSWRADELRLKSDSDLHKLWYVLLKEKLALKSDIYRLSQNMQKEKKLENYSDKVKISMKRLRTVVGERATLRNEFLMFLEFYYIRKKQLNPEYKVLSDIAAIPEETKIDKVKEEVIQKVSRETITQKKEKVVIRGVLPNEKTKAKNEEIQNIEDESLKPEIKIEFYSPPENDDEVSALDAKEIKSVDKLKKKYTKVNDLIDDYVTNRKMLRGRQKRKIVAAIDATRARQAKHIFMKEMSALSYKLKNTSTSKNPNIQKLENLS